MIEKRRKGARKLQKDNVGSAFEAQAAAGAENVSFLTCSFSGMIIYADPELSDIAGKDLVGRNIDCFLDPRVVSDIIAAYNDGETYNDRIVLSGDKFDIKSSTEGKYFSLTFKKADTGQDGIRIEEKDFEGLASSIRSALYSVVGIFQDPEFSGNAKIGEARKSFFKTYKKLNGMLDRIAFENELETGRAGKHDLGELCRAIIEKIAEYGNGYNVSFRSDLGSHICMVDKGQFDKALISIFIYLYNAFGEKDSKVGAAIENDGEKIYIKVTASRKDGAPAGKKALKKLWFPNEEDDILKNDDLFVAKKLIELNNGSIVALNRNGQITFTLTFVKAGKSGDTPLTFKDIAFDGTREAIDSMLLFELGETLSCDE